MKKIKTKQIHIEKFDYPFVSANQLFLNGPTFENICNDEEFSIKKFIGSDWSIKDSGFIFYCSNNLSFAFTFTNLEQSDFSTVNKFKITHINGKECKYEIYYLFSLINNTIDNTTIVEGRLEYDPSLDSDEFEKYINWSFAQKIIKKIFLKYNSVFYERLNKSNDFIIINHSFIIKKNYKDAFDFFYNWNNMAKSIKADKAWKIISEENDKKYKDFYIIINENIKIHYHVISIDEVNDEKIEIVYSKTNNSFPSLNNYIKFSFFNIAKSVCFFLYETHLPTNISASIYQTVSYYVYYCNKKSKLYIENNL
jgi:hypothetical protein